MDSQAGTSDSRRPMLSCGPETWCQVMFSGNVSVCNKFAGELANYSPAWDGIRGVAWTILDWRREAVIQGRLMSQGTADFLTPGV